MLKELREKIQVIELKVYAYSLDFFRKRYFQNCKKNLKILKRIQKNQ